MIFTGNLLIDTREKNDRALELLRQTWKEKTAGGCVVHGLGKSGGDFALEIEDEKGKKSAHPDIRVEAKWMSSSGPSDLFRSLSADYPRLKKELSNLEKKHPMSLFLCEGKASDLQAHTSVGGVKFDFVIKSMFALNAKYRIPFIFSDRATHWLCAWMVKAKDTSVRNRPASEDERPFILIPNVEDLSRRLEEQHPAGTQFFCGFPAVEESKLCELMINQSYGFWFFDGDEFPLDYLSRHWLKAERKETAIRAAGGFPPTPKHYTGKLRPLADYRPKTSGVRQRRHASIIFNDQGELPLFILFEVPKKRGVEIQILLPIEMNQKVVDVNAISKPSEVFVFDCLRDGFFRETDKTEAELIPEVLHRCREYWKDQAQCSEESSKQSSESSEDPAKEIVNVVEEAAKSTSQETCQGKEEDGSSVTFAAEPETNQDTEKEVEMLPEIKPQQPDSIILQQVDPAELELAMLKVCGLDKCSKEMQLIALKMANQYGFKLELKHIVPIQGALYITRDGLLHIAHKSGQLDGMEIIDRGEEKGAGWWCKFAVYRKDMSHPFVYVGRYNGSNRKYGPEMAVKCAESMALRRAFDVALCSREERFDLEEQRPQRQNSSNGNHQSQQQIIKESVKKQPHPTIQSSHKDQILKAFHDNNIPLSFMGAVSQLYGEEEWNQWNPNEEISLTAVTFLEVFSWLIKKLDQQAAIAMIQEEIVPLDMMPGIKGMLEGYVAKHCQDTDDPGEVEQVIIEAFEDLAMKV
jgi:hypothetical protein